jgi:hypothetical protein
MLTRRNYNQTNRRQTSSLSPTIGKDCASTTMIDRKISLAIEGLKRYVENWLRIRTSNENALTVSEYVLLLRREINRVLLCDVKLTVCSDCHAD